jgi:hypothetical protein
VKAGEVEEAFDSYSPALPVVCRLKKLAFMERQTIIGIRVDTQLFSLSKFQKTCGWQCFKEFG